MDKKQIMDIINNEDPVDLIKNGAPLDEYQLESSLIMNFIKNNNILTMEDEKIASEIRKVFASCFSTELDYDFHIMANKIKLYYQQMSSSMGEF